MFGLLGTVCSLLAAPAPTAPTVLPAVEPKSRVVIVHHPGATRELKAQPEAVREMVDQGLLRLTGKSSLPAAWLSLVSTQDVVGLKVFSRPGPHSGTRPAVVAAVAQGLIGAGLPPSRIIIWDKRRDALVNAGYVELARQLGVGVEAAADCPYDDDKYYDRALIGNLVFGDHEFGKKGEGVGRRSFVSTLVSRKMTKIIVITPLLNNNEVGVTGHLLSLALGSVDNTLRFETNPSQLAEAVPEIFALELLSDRVVLNITDALLCQYQGEQRSLLHYSVVLNELRFSRDPVALDVLSLQELERQRKLAGAPPLTIKHELYPNAALLELGVNDPKAIQIERLP